MSTVRTLAEDLHGILSSFGSMLEGVYHVDDELAAVIAEKFADRLRSDVRSIYAEMTAEISEGLKKPPKKRKRRVKQEMVIESDPDSPDRSIGAEELPTNENTLLNGPAPGGDPDQLATTLLNTERVTNRSGGSTVPGNSWDNDNPTMRRINRD